MTDPFERLHEITQERDMLTNEWVQEIRALRALGFSTRAIAQAAGVSHTTVWERS